MDGHTHTHTHGRYQTYYIPCFAVDNNVTHRSCRVPNIGLYQSSFSSGSPKLLRKRPIRVPMVAPSQQAKRPYRQLRNRYQIAVICRITEKLSVHHATSSLGLFYYSDCRVPKFTGSKILRITVPKNAKNITFRLRTRIRAFELDLEINQKLSVARKL